MRHKKNKTNRLPKMTDAELRRALDYSLGDEVYFFGDQAEEKGFISGIKPSKKGGFLIYQLVCDDGKGGCKTIQAISEQIRFIRHADE